MTAPIATGQTRDPVCGMVVDRGTAKHRAEHDGQTHYFCSAGCKAKFLADPTRLLQPADKTTIPLTAGTTYTRPMHPQIRRNVPGLCPICGMALEPEGIPEAEGTPWQRPSCSGVRGLFFSEHGRRSSTDRPTCSR